MAGSYDLLILTDATASMGQYLSSLSESLPEIIRISSLTGCFDRIGVLAYRDYFKGELTQWSGWHGKGCPTSREDLLQFTRLLRPEHGGDWPEAAKTGLAHAYEVMREEAQTLILLYADAPPHTPATGGTYHDAEQKLLKSGAYGGAGPLFLDWVSAANTLRRGAKKASVISIIQSHLADTLSLHLFLSHRTGGTCLRIPDHSKADFISSLTVSILLTWMGVQKSGTTPAGSAKLALIQNYADASTIDDVASEQDELSRIFFVKIDNKEYCNLVKNNLGTAPLTIDNMQYVIPRRRLNNTINPVVDFSKRYAVDKAYRQLVVDQLSEIIRADIVAITVNPVFGTLWRTVCNDRLNEARDKLIELFNTYLNRAVPTKKVQVRAWLTESYDYTGEIREVIESVPADERFPCVLLDPTISFTESDADGNRGPASMKFTREELMEIGRSCDDQVLRRLGLVLSRLTYLSSEAELPEHIKGAGEVDMPLIPMALATEKHNRRFWKVLLHAVLPGTKLSPRPAALLAALSLCMGFKPLEVVADEELLSYKSWNTLDIPETWNTNCLSLLLEADKNFRSRHQNDAHENKDQGTELLSQADRKLFEKLVDYKMLEMNLGTTLTARISWKPDKTKVSIGPLTNCKSCKYPRSVTVMSRNGFCGVCDEEYGGYSSAKERKDYIENNVSTKVNSKTSATWVECSMTYCRAQYIVYNVEKLKCRPKCWYCRQDGFLPKNHPERDILTVAPSVECSKCLSRVIWPAEYRRESFKEDIFKCPACEDDRVATVVDVSTSANNLIHGEHNGTRWFLRNDKMKIPKPFDGRSLYHVISTAGTEGFVDQVEILPSGLDPGDSMAPELRIGGKVVQNAHDLVESLRSWVQARRVECGTCSLCFSDFKKADLRAACGRRGCEQLVCGSCHDGWYGMNSPGSMINVAALSCPFCRRQPTAKVLPAALRALGNLKTAVDDSAWVYAWCQSCGMACRYAERVCAEGAPPYLSAWRCDDCRGRGGIPVKKVPIMKCPGCGVHTEKISGCNHMQCTQCHVDWCFFCGGKLRGSADFTHMAHAHGGWYDVDTDDDGD